MRKRVKRFLLQTPFGRILLIPLRFRIALGYYMPKLKRAIRWALTSREFTNFTFEITPENFEYLAHTVSTITSTPYGKVIGFMHELQQDEDLKKHVVSRVRASAMRYSSDERFEPGRRIGWYAFVRIMKPGVVVETGVDKGLGAVVLCSALLRNAKEGYPGRYFGTDKNPEAGFLMAEPYSEVGKILYGDSIGSLESIREIDIFINDSDHSAEYEAREYQAIATKLNKAGGLILGDNAHCTDVLAKFSAEHGRSFIFFREEPQNHWYPGAGIGISFVREARESFPAPRSHEAEPLAGN